MYKILHIPSGTYLLKGEASTHYLSDVIKGRTIWSKLEIELYHEKTSQEYGKLFSALNEKLFTTKLSAKKYLRLYLNQLADTFLGSHPDYNEYNQENFYEIVKDE